MSRVKNDIFVCALEGLLERELRRGLTSIMGLRQIARFLRLRDVGGLRHIDARFVAIHRV